MRTYAHMTSRGMTLLEVVVWIAVFTAAMLALSTSVLYFYRSSSYAIQQSSAVASAQHGMDLMVRTIREASYAGNGAYPIVSFGPNDLRFYVDDDGDFGIEEVHYYLSGTNLMKGVVQPSGDPVVYTGTESASAVSDNVRNAAQGASLFAYYDENGAQITDFSKRADVRFITATLMVDVDPNRSPMPLMLRSSAALRNLIGR